jgi:hypothetical protein
MEPKKRSVGATERDEWLRAAWRVMVAQELDARSVVFVDEMGTNTSLSPLYAWAPTGERASCSVPRNRGPNTTLLSSMTLEGMGTSLAVEGATNREVFEAYVQRVLAPTLRPGQVVTYPTKYKRLRVAFPRSSLGRVQRTIGSNEALARRYRIALLASFATHLRDT